MSVIQAETVIVQGGNFVNVEQDEDVLNILEPRTSPNARYNARYHEEPAQCHPGTRERILGDLNESLNNLKSSAFVWTHGPAGVGKTAVMRTLCQAFDTDKKLLGSFFFFKADPTRNSGQHFVPTLAYFLCQATEELRAPILDSIRRDPAVLKLGLEAQAQRLLIEPILGLVKSNQFPCRPPQAIVIDGFDECDSEYDRDQIIRVLHNLLQAYPSPLLIFVTSRPHFDIRIHFESSPLLEKTTQRGIYQDTQADADIRKYLVDKFNEILRRHRLRKYLPLSADGLWPSLAIIELLVDKASGQFIFAATVIRFIQSPTFNPETRLQVLLRFKFDEDDLDPFDQLNKLYRAIFASIPRSLLRKTLDMLAICIVYPDIFPRGLKVKPIPAMSGRSHQLDVLSIVEYAERFDPDNSTIGPESLEALGLLISNQATYFLELAFPLESLVEVIPHSKGSKQWHTLRPFHKSLADFLTSESRAGPDLFVPVPSNQVLTHCWIACLRNDFWHEDESVMSFIFRYLRNYNSRSISLGKESNDPSSLSSEFAGLAEFANYSYEKGLACATSFLGSLSKLDATTLEHIKHQHHQSFTAHLRTFTSAYAVYPELFSLMSIAFSARGDFNHVTRRYRLASKIRRALDSSPELLQLDVQEGFGLTANLDACILDLSYFDLDSFSWASPLADEIKNLLFDGGSQRVTAWYSIIDTFAEKAIQRGEVSIPVSQVVFSQLSFQYAAGSNSEDADLLALLDAVGQPKYFQAFLDAFPNHLEGEQRAFVQKVVDAVDDSKEPSHPYQRSQTKGSVSLSLVPEPSSIPSNTKKRTREPSLPPSPPLPRPDPVNEPHTPKRRNVAVRPSQDTKLDVPLSSSC